MSDGFSSSESFAPTYASEIMALQQTGAEVSVTEKSVERSAFGVVAEMLTVVALGVLLAAGLHIFVTQVYAISGESMEPTLHNQERVVISKLSPGLVGIERGDMIIFTHPRRPEKNLIKRVIGLPGDVIQIQHGHLLRNGQRVTEAYAVPEEGYSRSWGPGEVPEGHVFVMGDNRPHSQDSRDFGPIAEDTIKGTVFARIWPLESLSFFP